MAAAASLLNINIKTLMRRAKLLGCYNPNPGGKGTKKSSKAKVTISSILNGEHPSFQTNKLRLRLLKEGVLENCCTICGLKEWNGKHITCELDHINGDRTDHHVSNIRLLCPNCHSQTSTFRGKNKKKL